MKLIIHVVDRIEYTSFLPDTVFDGTLRKRRRAKLQLSPSRTRMLMTASFLWHEM